MPTCTAQHARAPRHDTLHGVVHAPRDAPIMEQKIFGDATQPRARVVIRDAKGLVTQVAAGQDDRPIHALQHQVVQRRIGQHQAERCDARRHAGGDAPTRRGVHDNDRS